MVREKTEIIWFIYLSFYLFIYLFIYALPSYSTSASLQVEEIVLAVNCSEINYCLEARCKSRFYHERGVRVICPFKTDRQNQRVSTHKENNLSVGVNYFL